ncbi:hypothetical protein A2154_02100 [Candidatus Gottesmanbacteria bacterium RBG_16_43_7]|uniref:Glycosyltransferase RgtA/B/C/D-like domain-containing protein n=1 Tax=Candidatus Gottesmanbacteria bacterium RBG_16_43_7 TaxID=1798373 RepID=A0A1F5ZCA8_9BACT|nr:MAG: hypothetical protein A2154_02100 [Candidatus Gottesmanbacteria bacterium RBG_16_43_7]
MRFITSLILLFGLVLRIIVAVYSFSYRDNPDIIRYKDWAKISYIHGYAATYKTDFLTFGTIPNTMPPGSLYVISGAYRLHLLTTRAILRIYPNSTNLQAIINGPLQNFILRLPQVFSDCLVALLIFNIVKRKFSTKIAITAMSIYLFNPVIWYNSAFWGQMDGIMYLFIMLGLYFVYKKNITLSILSMFFSLYIKLTPIMIIPVFIVYWIKIGGWKNIFISVLKSLVLLWFLTLLVSPDPIKWFMAFLYDNSIGEMQLITNHAFNFWWMVIRPFSESGNPSDIFSFSNIWLSDGISSSNVFLGVKLLGWGIILFAVFTLGILVRIYRVKTEFISFTTYSALIALVGFLFLPHMHERYLFSFFGLFIINWPLFIRYKFLYFLILTANAVNLYIIWHPIQISIFPYFVWNQQYFQWYISIILTISGVLLYFLVLKSLKDKAISRC